MKRYILVLLIAITAIVTELKAVTAYPYPIRFVQPDKTTVLTITMKGDERIKWAETEDGYSLIYNDAGYFCYATKDESGNMVPSQHIATDIAARSAEVEAFLAQTPKRLFYSDVQVKTMIEIWEMANEKNLKANEKTATTGRVKFPVILASFSNKSFTKTKAQFNNLLNQVNYNSTGSVYDFYNENSYGKMQLQFVVVGPVQLSQNIAYYGNNTNGNSQQFAREAVTLADDSTDFSQFDNDGNGYVDGVHIFFAGFGEESGGGADCIWSHRGTLSSPVIVDGKRLRDYSCSPEMRGSSGSVITNIGVICHELGHVFGSPDFYDTDYGSSGGEYPGTGTWDIMASGSWNNNGVTPAHHNPYSKCYIYGWATPRTLTQPEAVVMLNAEEYSNSFYRVETTTANEYFLLENRQKFKFDANIPGSGLVIYRVHKNGVPGYNVNTTHPQRFYVVSATSTSSIPTSTVSSYGSLNSTSCAFGNTKFDFTDATTPSSKSWAGGNTNKPINGITKVARNRTVCFLFKGATINPGSFQAEASSAHAVRLSWQLYNYKKVLLVYSSNGVFGTPQGDVYNAGDNISGGGVVIYQGYSTSFDHTGLSPQTLYKYKIFSLETDGWTTGVEASATTLSEAVAIPYTENFDADSTMPARWTCDYEYENYQWVVANSSNGSYTPHSQNNYLFSVAPSTSYNGTTTTIISVPVNTTTVQNAHISFWLRNQRRLTTTDILTVKCRASATSPWEVLATYESGISNWREEAFNLPNSDYVQVAFESTSYNGRGVGIDDVTFAQGSVGINTALEENVDVTIYPNPASDKTTISAVNSDKAVNYEVYDLMGRQLVNGEVEAHQTSNVNTNNWKAGVYIVRLKTGDKQKTLQLIVK